MIHLQVKIKKLKFLKYNWTKVSSIFLFILLLSAYTNIFAIGSPYSPGAILDPACSPGEVNCTVIDSSVNISGGLGGQILFQSAVGVTNKLANGTAGQVLTSGGTTVAPSWTTVASSPIAVVATGNLFSIGLTGTASGATGISQSIFLGDDSGFGTSSVGASNFIGVSSGYSASSSQFSNFIGFNAGRLASSANNSNFIGNSAGDSAYSSQSSNFIGELAGSGAYSATGSNFIGFEAGYGAFSSSYSNLFGYKTGVAYTGNNIGTNNIIIGTNISLPNTTANAINLGGVLFATGTYSTISGDPSITSVANGKVGIGTVTPGYKLHVFAPSQANTGPVDVMAVEVGATTDVSKLGYGPSILFKDIPGGTDIVNLARVGAVYEFNGTNYRGALAFYTNDQTSSGATSLPLERMRISAIGNVGIGMIDPSVALDVTGDIEYTGIITDVSDERLKENIQPITGALDMVLGIQGKYYNMIDTPNRLETGFIAQNVKQYVPSSVSIVDPENGYMGVSYSSLIPVAFEAIKEMNLKLDNMNNSNQENTWRENLIAWVGNTANGINEFVAGTFRAKDKLCINDTCITEDQLKILLQNSEGSTSNSVSVPTLTPVPIPVIIPTCTDLQNLVDNVCIDKVIELTGCVSPQILTDGVCVDTIIFPTCTDSQTLVNNICEENVSSSL